MWYFVVKSKAYKDKLLILDHCIHELVFIKRLRPKYLLIESVLSPLLPKPDQMILLQANSRTIFKRKPELSQFEIESYYNRLEEIFLRNNIDYEIVSSDKDPVESLNCLVRLILQLIDKKKRST